MQLNDNLRYNTSSLFIIVCDMLLILYENGTKDIFSNAKETLEVKKDDVKFSGIYSEQYLKGEADALKYHKGYKDAATGAFLTVLMVTPLIGLAPAIVCSSTKQKEINLNYPGFEFIKNPDYYNGYTEKAIKIKQNRVWANYAFAFSINAMIFTNFSNKLIWCLRLPALDSKKVLLVI